ncbi:MAG TPA: CDP-diacylglycerol--serine O-phosphatidyltransferase [Gemmatimonadaceae bacterium]
MSDIDHTRARKAIVVLPSGFTVGNLFFGFFAIVEASRGDLSRAALYVVLGGVLDAFDGRVARATRTGSRFGEELDSLVDAISFGLAPALIMYFAVLNREGWDWIWAFLFTACAVIRLARFNVEQAGTSKTHFHGLPSPAAGMTLATYWWFSQTTWYTETAIGDLPWHVMLRFVMALLAFLMISDVPYPVVPTVNFRSARGIAGAIFITGVVFGVIFLPQKVFFPLLLGYVLFGAVKYFFLGLADRLPADDVLLEEEDESGQVRHVPAEHAPVDGAAGAGRRRRRRRRPPRRSGPGSAPDSPSEDTVR